MDSQRKDYYRILGVPKDASDDEIKKAYRKLSKQWHPDLNKSPEAKDRFAEINEAHQVLSDPEKRRAYDNPGFGGFGGFGPGGFGGARQYTSPDGSMHFEWSSDGPGGMDGEAIREFMRRMGGMGGMGGQWGRPDPNAPRDGEDILLVLGITFRESIDGCRKTIRLNVEDNGPNGDRVKKTVTVEVKVPAGIPDGMRLRVPDRGNRGVNGGRNGDIYLQMRIAPDPVFQRDVYDLWEKVPVPFETFVLGGEVEIQTLDGTEKYRVEPGSVPGRTATLTGRGAPVMNATGQHGDLNLLLQLEWPKDLTDRERELLGKYRDERAGREMR